MLALGRMTDLPGPLVTASSINPHVQHLQVQQARLCAWVVMNVMSTPAQSPVQNTCWKRVLIRHTFVAGASSTSAAAITQTARFKSKSYSNFCTRLPVIALQQNTNMTAELDAAMGRVGLPSNYAKDAEKQAELANGTVFNCYRSSQRPIPLALLYPVFDGFCLRFASPGSISVRDSLFCLELCQEMQRFVSKEIKREQTFGTLFREYLKGQLSSDMALTHQTRGKSIVDIQLQVKVGTQQGTASHITGE